MFPRLSIILTALVAAFCLIAASPALAQEVDLGIITVKSKSQAEKLRNKLLKGASFEELAKAESVGPASFKGGRLGKVPNKKLRSEYKQALKGLAPGKPSKVIPTEEGFTILMRFEGMAPSKAQAPAPTPVPLITEKPKPKPEPSAPAKKVKVPPHLDARSKVMAGLESLRAGELTKGEKSFAEALRLNPAEDSAEFFLAMTKRAKAQYLNINAVKTFAQGFILMLEGEAQNALDLFKKSASQDPKLWEARLFEANLLISVQKQNQASELLAEVLKVNPKSGRAHISLGLIALDNGSVKDAFAEFEKALELNPRLAEAHYQLGVLYLAKGDLKKAMREFKATVAIDPYHDAGFNDLGLTQQYTGQEAAAEKSFKRTLALNPSFVPAHINLGNLYLAQEKANKAIDEFNKALGMDPDMALVHVNLAAAYIYKKDWPLAIAHADLALEKGMELPPAIAKALEDHRVKN